MLNAIAKKNFLYLATRNRIKTRNVTTEIFMCVTRYVTVVELFSGAELRIKKCYNMMKNLLGCSSNYKNLFNFICTSEGFYDCHHNNVFAKMEMIYI